MTYIKELVEDIEEEVNGAKDYAEKYVECKAKGNIDRANHFKEMANDELRHAMYIHEIAVTEIDRLSKIYTPPVEMQQKWEKAHAEYVEKVAWIKQMLTM